MSQAGPTETSVVAENTDNDVFHVTADQVTIKGFTVTGATGHGKRGVYLDNVNGFKITGNHVNGNSNGIRLQTSTNGTVSENDFSSNYTGIVMRDSTDNTLQGNIVSNNDFNGIHMADGSGNNDIKDNNVSDNGTSGIYLHSTGSSNNTIKGNTISNNDHGIYMHAGPSDNVISDNTISNNISVGIWFNIAANDNTLTNNTISNNNIGIFQSYFEIYPSSGNSVHHNSIYGNIGSGVHNQDTRVDNRLDATNNWWGAANGPGGEGPGDGDDVSENVLFDPWAESPF